MLKKRFEKEAREQEHRECEHPDFPKYKKKPSEDEEHKNDYITQ